VSEASADPGLRPERVDVPLVTIGIPTYNRPAGLERALRSARGQDAARLEILVSDNASEDPEVERVGRAAAVQDERIRYVRQPVNRGHAANFQWLLEHGHGDLFMWLADDDWIDPAYVSRCREELLADPGTALVCGHARYYVDGRHVLDERVIELASSDPSARVVRYFARVSLNGPMSGIARRADLLRTGFPPTLAGDWLLVGALATRGRVRTLPDVHVHRSMTGMGTDPEALARDLRAAETGHARVAAQMWREAIGGRLAPPGAGPARRAATGTAIGGLVLFRFTLPVLVRRVLGGRAARLESAISAALRRRDRA
jgi:hypothetical protein